jgi:very-short-patch-repair endonuclease
MKTTQIMKRDFNNSQISQRTSDKFFNATELLAVYNNNSESQKRFKDFWENKNTQQIYLNLCQKLNMSKLHETSRGKGGATWMHEELLYVFYNWLHKIPNQTITRDELVFCDYVEQSFKGILTFERQKRFGNYLVDLYCNELNLCIEFDEEHHSKNIILDTQRQSNIENQFGVSFIRHKIKDNYSITINKILLLWKNLKVK